MSEFRKGMISRGRCVDEDAELFERLDQGNSRLRARALGSCAVCSELQRCVSKLNERALLLGEHTTNSVLAGMIFDSSLDTQTVLKHAPKPDAVDYEPNLENIPNDWMLFKKILPPQYFNQSAQDESAITIEIINDNTITINGETAVLKGGAHRYILNAMLVYGRPATVDELMSLGFQKSIDQKKRFYSRYISLRDKLNALTERKVVGSSTPCRKSGKYGFLHPVKVTDKREDVELAGDELSKLDDNPKVALAMMRDAIAEKKIILQGRLRASVKTRAKDIISLMCTAKPIGDAGQQSILESSVETMINAIEKYSEASEPVSDEAILSIIKEYVRDVEVVSSRAIKDPARVALRVSGENCEAILEKYHSDPDITDTILRNFIWYYAAETESKIVEYKSRLSELRRKYSRFWQVKPSTIRKIAARLKNTDPDRTIDNLINVINSEVAEARARGFHHTTLAYVCGNKFTKPKEALEEFYERYYCARSKYGNTVPKHVLLEYCQNRTYIKNIDLFKKRLQLVKDLVGGHPDFKPWQKQLLAEKANYKDLIERYQVQLSQLRDKYGDSDEIEDTALQRIAFAGPSAEERVKKWLTIFRKTVLEFEDDELIEKWMIQTAVTRYPNRPHYGLSNLKKLARSTHLVMSIATIVHESGLTLEG